MTLLSDNSGLVGSTGCVSNTSKAAPAKAPRFKAVIRAFSDTISELEMLIRYDESFMILNLCESNIPLVSLVNGAVIVTKSDI